MNAALMIRSIIRAITYTALVLAAILLASTPSLITGPF